MSKTEDQEKALEDLRKRDRRNERRRKKRAKKKKEAAEVGEQNRLYVEAKLKEAQEKLVLKKAQESEASKLARLALRLGPPPKPKSIHKSTFKPSYSSQPLILRLEPDSAPESEQVVPEKYLEEAVEPEVKSQVKWVAPLDTMEDIDWEQIDRSLTARQDTDRLYRTGVRDVFRYIYYFGDKYAKNGGRDRLGIQNYFIIVCPKCYHVKKMNPANYPSVIIDRAHFHGKCPWCTEYMKGFMREKIPSPLPGLVDNVLKSEWELIGQDYS